MTTDIEQYASVAGELAKNLYGRTDFEKYDSAWARAQNWFVDYRGGLFTRPGFIFDDYIGGSGANGEYIEGDNVKFVPFQFAPDVANTYLCIFTHERIRLVQDGAYVLETPFTIDDVTLVGSDIEITTSAPHGYSTDDWIKLSGFADAELIKLNGRSVRIEVTSATIFLIKHIQTGDDLGTTIGAFTYTTGAESFRIFTLVSPYVGADLPILKAIQIRDTVRLTHGDYAIRNLERMDHADWTLTLEETENTLERVIGGNVAATAGAGNKRAIYVITAVYSDGRESLQSFPVILTVPNMEVNQDAAATIEWDPVTNGEVEYYNVYRSRIKDDTVQSIILSNTEIGFVGRSSGTAFTDMGVTPDFQRRPFRSVNPFGGGTVEHVRTITPGSGHDFTTPILEPAGGSDFLAYPVLMTSDGEIRGVEILRGGTGYTGTQVLAGSPGTGYEGEARLSALTGNNPHCSAIFEQRQIYGATDNFPLRIFGSQPGLLSSFDESPVQFDDNAYQFDIDTARVAPIRHLMPVRGGLMALSQIGVWLVFGKGNNPLTPNNAQADLQNNIGASHVQPQYLDNYIIYIAAKGEELRMLVYDDYAKVFGGKNVSILSNHLFSSSNPVESLDYAASPFKLVPLTHEDGRGTMCAIDNENNVYAATPWVTNGKFKYAASVDEDNDDTIYFAIERDIAGSGDISPHKALFLEQLADRRFPSLEKSFCVDSGLQAEFGSPVTEISGFAHLAGNAIKLLADGEVVDATVDQSGSVILAEAATDVSGGLGYSCIAQTLPLTAQQVPIEGRRKDIVGASIRILETYGLKVGSALNRLRLIQDRDLKFSWSTGIPRFLSGMIYEPVAADYSRDRQIYFVQDSPRPAAILNFLRDMDMGDDKD